jgi:hypothetical protein
MSIDEQMSDLIAMSLTGGGTVEACGQDTLLKNEHRTDEGTVTGAAFRNRICDFHKIRIPVRAHGMLISM